MSCKISFLKAILAILNTLLSLLGIGLIALSVFELNSSTPGTSEHIAIVVQIFIGSFVILTSFLGCFSACRESLGATWSFATCLFILLAFQIYIIIVAHSTDYKQNARDDFNGLWSNYTLNAEQIANTEQEYSCCGKNGSQDYALLGKGIPKGCYRSLERASENLYINGCLDALQKKAAENGERGLMIKWTLFFIELFALGFAALMGITIRNKQRRQQFGNQ